MPRVIEDSDGEDDIGEDVAPAESATIVQENSNTGLISTNVEALTTTPAQTAQTNGTRGTSSSETLRRDIHAATSALFEPTPSSSGKHKRTLDDLSLSTNNSSKVSPDKSRLKRTRTTGTPLSSKNVTFQDSSSLKTYGAKQRTRHHSSARFESLAEETGHGGDLWDVPSSVNEGLQDTISTITTQNHDIAAQEKGLINGTIDPRRLSRKGASQDSIQDVAPSAASITPFAAFPMNSSSTSNPDNSFMTHNPIVLFPDSSADLTNATSLPEASARLETIDASVDQDKTNEEGESLPEMSLNVALADTLETTVMQDQLDVPIDGTIRINKSASTMPAQDPSVNGDRPSSTADSDMINHVEQANKKRKRTLSRKKSVAVELGVEEAPQLSLKEQLPVSPVDDAESEQSLDNTQSKRQNITIDSTKDQDHDTDPNTDELDIDLPPKDMYKPRPSTSRGANVAIDTTIDLTKSPKKKKNSKSKLKRRQTTGAITSYSSALREMGYRSSQVEEALSATNGSYEEAIELLTSRHDTVFEATVSVSNAKQREPGLDNTVQENGGGDAHEDLNTETHEPKKKRGRQKKVVETPVVEVEVEQILHEDEVIGDEIETIKEPVETLATSEKRGRGRPKRQKSARSVVEEEVVVNHTAEVVELADDRPQPLAEEVPGILTDSDLNKASRTPKAKDVGDQAATPAKGHTEPQESTTMTKTTPERAATPATGPKKLHSPIKKDKIPYKVGLSKRARIEPLLRMIKK